MAKWSETVEKWSNYTAFGSPMPGRNFSPNAYRYNFNGKESDVETGTQDYGMRIYNPALARFLSVDPITDQYPELTPYQFASNTPIMAADLDGLERDVRIFDLRGDKPVIKKVYSGDKEFGWMQSGAGSLWQPFDGAGPSITEYVIHKDESITAFQTYKAEDGTVKTVHYNEDEVNSSKEIGEQREEKIAEAFNLFAETGPGHMATGSPVSIKKGPGVNGNGKKTHGNKLDDKPAEGYSLRDKKTGGVKKFGETTRGEDAFGAGKQKRYSKGYLKGKDLYYQKEISGTKKGMHKWQHDKIIDHKNNNKGDRPDLNKSDY